MIHSSVHFVSFSFLTVDSTDMSQSAGSTLFADG